MESFGLAIGSVRSPWIQYITNLIETDLRRKTNRSHALRPIDQVLIAMCFLACSRLSVSGEDRKSSAGQGDERGLTPLVASSRAAFPIFPTDREPGTGYAFLCE